MVFEAQHLSSSSGDANAYAVTLEDQSRRVVFSTHEAVAVANGRAPEDGPIAGPDVERTSAAPAISGQTGDGR
jgi:hypothetical protein